jgi:hypothetical protein
MIRGNMFDVFAVKFSDGQEVSMIAKDADTARSLAQYSYPKKQIVKVWEITYYDYDK